MSRNGPLSTPPVAIQHGVAFGEADGQPLLMDIARPEPLPDAPMPAVVHIHGSGWVAGERELEDVRFAAHGFFYCSIDYRLAPDATFPTQIHDCKAAVRFLRANADEFHIDPQRIGVWGHSAGGHIASLLGTSYGIPELEGESGTPGVSSRVQAVCAVSPPSYFLDPTPRWRRQWAPDDSLFALFGGPPEGREALARLADLATHAREDAPPFLLIHGDRDMVVPAGHALGLHEALMRVGGDTTLVVLGEVEHDLGENWDGVRRLMLEFFQRHLS